MTNRAILAHLLFRSFREQVREAVSKSNTIGFYTPHGMSHIQGVEETVAYLKRFLAGPHGLNTLEDLLLRFCAWGHDLGMIQGVARKYQEEFGLSTNDPDKLRQLHDKASAHFIQVMIPALLTQTLERVQGKAAGVDANHAREKLLHDLRDEFAQQAGDDSATPSDEVLQAAVGAFSDPAQNPRWLSQAVTLAYSVNLIARYHRRAEVISACPVRRDVFEQKVRVRLLAALFRLADALHVDRTRFEATAYEMIMNSPRFTDESRMHWIKSFIVSSIRVDQEKHCVHVQADLPVEKEIGPEFGVDSSRLRAMLTFIANDLAEDVLSVSSILLEYGFPALLGVTCEVHEIPAMQYPQDVRAALNHVLATSSPNTTQLVTIALNVLEWHLRESDHLDPGKGNTDAATYLWEKMENQISSIDEQLDKRPCHEGLRKFRDLLWAVKRSLQVARGEVATLSGMLGAAQLARTLLDGVKRTFLEQREAVRTGTRTKRFLNLLDGVTDIVLYGYSEQVIGLLTEFHAEWRKNYPTIHIMECRTKTSYSPAGNLLYLDAERYGRTLNEKLLHRGTITIEPDASVARTLRLHGDAGRQVLLLGSNAVYTNGTFVHSMGHLTMAAAAKAPGGSAQVIVLTDSTKIGGSKQAGSERERNPSTWLTHNQDVVRDLQRADIEPHNWLEDAVPPEMVDLLLVLDRQEILTPPYKTLEAVRFDARACYTERLPTRVLASYVAQQRQQSGVPKMMQDDLARLGGIPMDEWPNVRGYSSDWEARSDRKTDVENWRLAEAYLRVGKETAADDQLALSGETQTWLDNRWTNQLQEATLRLCSAIRAADERTA